MKALTVSEPWATLIMFAGKDVENRTWQLNYRGPLIIHAGKRMEPRDSSGWDSLAFHAARRFDPTCRAPDAYVLPEFGGLLELVRPGYALGIVDVIGCDEADGYSPWECPGQWHIRLANPRPFREPFQTTGQLGLFNIPDEQIPPVIERT